MTRKPTAAPARTVVSLSALALIATASVLFAGPINPPAGPIVPTGQTLDAIFNKIPGGNGTGDGRTAIPASATQVTINQPGSYVLTGNISTTGIGILILASDVTLDLNGFRVASSATGAFSPITFGTGTFSNITIRNGSLSGGQIGIGSTTGTQNGVLLEDLRILNAKQIGINLNNTANRDIQLRRCHVIDTGSTTTAADGSLTIAGINLGGTAHRVEDCTVTRLLYNGGGTGTFRGITVSTNNITGCLVANCCVAHDAAITGIGISFANGGIYRDNNVMLFSTPYSVAGSTDGGGNH